MNLLVSNDIDTLIIGKNKGWKQNIDLKNKNNQNFVSIPFATLINQLTYKCKLSGIEVITHEESYTSKLVTIGNYLVHLPMGDNYVLFLIMRMLRSTNNIWVKESSVGYLKPIAAK